MSDVVRNYTGSVTMSRQFGRRRRGKGCSLVILLILLLCGAWLYHVTRDTHALNQLVPADQAYHVYVADVLDKRAPLLESDVWNLVPEDSPYQRLRARFEDDLPVPDWVANNLLYGVCHVSGQDLTHFDDALFVIKMSRVGCIIERFASFFGNVDHDHAGGLELTVLPGDAGYYAVRGRVLAVSRSRDALIRSLTLAPDDVFPPEAFARGMASALERDIVASLRPGAEDVLGDLFSVMDLALEVRGDGMSLTASATLDDECRQKYASVLGPMVAGQVGIPSGGLVTVAADLGQPLPTFLRSLDGLLFPEGTDSPLNSTMALFALPEDEATPLMALLPTFAGTLDGGAAWLQWRGAALNAMLPLPVLMGAFEADESAVMEAMTRFATIPEGSETDPHYIPRFDESSGIVHVPLIGGPEIEPSFGYRDGRLLLSNSRLALEEGLSNGTGEVAPDTPTNLYIRLLPAPACESAVAIGQQIADAGLLRGFTAESFANKASEWTHYAGLVREATLSVAHDSGKVQLRANIAMAPGS